MNPHRFPAGLLLAAAAGLLLLPNSLALAAPPDADALLYSTMPSTAAHRPEMATDGDPNTYFRTAYGMGGGDTFMVLFSRAIPIRHIHIVTGDPDGGDILTQATLQVSRDLKAFKDAGAFDAKGVLDARPPRGDTLALRIRLNRRRRAAHLVVRDITIDSAVHINHIQYAAGRGFSDLSQAPDLVQWDRRAEEQMQDFWPDTAALLYSSNFITPNMVFVEYRTGPGVTGVAATGGGVMTVNSAWSRAHPEDTGLTVHEMAHVVQSMSAYDPVWLVEGIADYIRWVRFEPQNYRVQINPRRATYHDSYRTTGAFLGWCELHYDSRLVTKLNQDVRFGTYKPELFAKYCGKDVDTLWSEFMAAYQADPVHVLQGPMGPGDRPRPRPLPSVAPGSSVPVSLAPLFSITGIVDDGKRFPAEEGFDSGGAAYPSRFLPVQFQWKNLQFTLGAPGVADTVACRGQVVPLPAGQYHSLWLLGSGVQGDQRGQVLTVTYTDGSTAALTQSFSDWAEAQDFPGESLAVRVDYRTMTDGSKDSRDFYVYTYGFDLDPGKTVRSLTLPDNTYVRLLAVTLAK